MHLVFSSQNTRICIYASIDTVHWTDQDKVLQRSNSKAPFLILCKKKSAELKRLCQCCYWCYWQIWAVHLDSLLKSTRCDANLWNVFGGAQIPSGRRAFDITNNICVRPTGYINSSHINHHLHQLIREVAIICGRNFSFARASYSRPSI